MCNIADCDCTTHLETPHRHLHHHRHVYSHIVLVIPCTATRPGRPSTIDRQTPWYWARLTSDMLHHITVSVLRLAQCHHRHTPSSPLTCFLTATHYYHRSHAWSPLSSPGSITVLHRCVHLEFASSPPSPSRIASHRLPHHATAHGHHRHTPSSPPCCITIRSLYPSRPISRVARVRKMEQGSAGTKT